ncbi:MAG: branched-chain amino acid ABC transporter permease [Proteobacteria bacterium]|nr:branched-chain amino acid ABC transporter permease [Pseudomonadota bacterium]
MEFWIIQSLNGLSFGALLFLLASGLSLIFGVMNIVNVAHGSYFMIGGYLGYSVFLRTGSFVIACLAAAVAVAMIGIAMHFFLLRRYSTHFPQVLMTMGFALIFRDLTLVIWGGDPLSLATPAVLQGSFHIGPITYPIYRSFVILIAIAVAIGLWAFNEKTSLGAKLRATVDDNQMATGIGINVPMVSSLMFGLGAFLAGFGGVVGAPILGIFAGIDFDILPLAFVVVIVGGMGSLKGAAVGSILVGVVDTLGKALVPDLSYFTLFLPMAIVLAIKPTGLFGRA